jgi:hypothetical protein
MPSSSHAQDAHVEADDHTGVRGLWRRLRVCVCVCVCVGCVGAAVRMRACVHVHEGRTRVCTAAVPRCWRLLLASC